MVQRRDRHAHLPLRYENAALVAVLRPMISPDNPITANPGNNTLVITDYADNLGASHGLSPASILGPAWTPM